MKSKEKTWGKRSHGWFEVEELREGEEKNAVVSACEAKGIGGVREVKRSRACLE